MVNKDLIDYIRSESSRGIARDTTRDMLTKSGWQIADIEEAERIVFATPTASPQTPQATTPITTTFQTQQPIQQQPVQQPLQTTQPATQSFTKPTTQPISQPSTPKQQMGFMQKPNLAGALDAYRQKTSVLSSQPTQPIQSSNPFQPTNPQTIAEHSFTNHSFSQQPVMISQPKKSKSRLAFVAVIIFLILLSGGAAYAYYAGYLMTSAKFGSGVTSAFNKATGASFTATAHIDLSGTGDSNNLLNMLPGFSPVFDLDANGTYGTSIENEASVDATAKVTAGTLTTDASLRLVGTTLFIKLTKIPDVSLMTNYSGEWLSLPLANTIMADGNLTDASTNAGSKLTITQHFPPEIVNGVLLYHIGYTVGSISGEAWIGQSDMLPYKITATLNAADKIATATIQVKDWNTPVRIDTPAESLPFDAFIEKSSQDAENKHFDESAKADLMSLQQAAEDYFAGASLSYKNFCKSQAFTDATANSLATFTCRDSATTYIMYAPLSETTGTIACIDTGGKEVDLSKEPTKGFICK